ncbi:sec-independent protein translocase protein TatB-like isoform X1 [Zingiber officinale]|nr:sec-independent protein translocase protein TatB-like isoform X1 [Zingiber officinale]XP_042448732.1 sec-independent protein translocase protein TatB-like isoform X1 [Zingiber officinale]
MFGISFGQLFLVIGAAGVLVKPKDLPVIAKTAGRLVGKAVGHVLLFRSQLQPIIQQSEATKVHKELRDAIAQYEVIRHEIRNLGFLHPDPFMRRLDIPESQQSTTGSDITDKTNEENAQTTTIPQVLNRTNSASSRLHGQASSYAQLVQDLATKSGTSSTRADGTKPNISVDLDKENSASTLHSRAIAYAKLAEALDNESGPAIHETEVKPNAKAGLPNVLPVCAETLGLLPKRSEEINGSDIMLQAMLEEQVAHKAKDFFSQPENQLPTQK